MIITVDHYYEKYKITRSPVSQCTQFALTKIAKFDILVIKWFFSGAYMTPKVALKPSISGLQIGASACSAAYISVGCIDGRKIEGGNPHKYGHDTCNSCDAMDLFAGYGTKVIHETKNRVAGAIFTKGDKVIIGIGGVKHLKNAIKCSKAYPKPFGPMVRGKCGGIHNGIMESSALLIPEIAKCIVQYSAKNNIAIEDLQIEIYGHSMGGALGLLLFLFLQKNYPGFDPNNCFLVQFGAPSVLDKLALSSIPANVQSRIFRVVAAQYSGLDAPDNDKVATMAPMFLLR